MERSRLHPPAMMPEKSWCDVVRNFTILRRAETCTIHNCCSGCVWAGVQMFLLRMYMAIDDGYKMQM